MKLTHLDLTNFRSFRGTSLDLDASRVLFTGTNGVGKSSTADAISWALTGVCRGTDGRGAGADVLIPEGGNIAEVVVGIEGIGRVSRSYAERGGGAFSVEGFTGTSQVQSQALLNKLNTTPEFLRAVLSTEAFLDLSHVEAKAMVLSLLNVMFQLPDATGRVTLDELDMHHKQAFEDRKAAKKALQNCVVPQMPSSAPMPTTDAIKEQLDRLRGQLGLLQTATGSVTGRRQALQDEQARLKVVADESAGEDLSGQIDVLQAKLASLEAAVVPAVPVEAPKKGDPQRLNYLRSSVEALQQYEPNNSCVVNPDVPCKTPPKAFRDQLAAFVKELKALDPKPEKSPQTPTESPLTAVRQQLEDLKQREFHRKAILKNHALAEDRLKQIRQELDALTSTEAQDKEIATLQERIGKGEQLLKDARAHWHDLEVRHDALRRQESQKKEVERLEELVEQLGPNGIRVQALAEAMGSFEAAVNPYVEPFGWKITFSVEPWTVFANSRPVETYSRSERYRIGIALQMGIAMLSGLKFAVVDEMDMLSHDNRAAVTAMLLKAPLDQILVMGTREPSQKLPAIPGIVAYRLAKAGQSSVIAERSAA